MDKILVLASVWSIPSCDRNSGCMISWVFEISSWWCLIFRYSCGLYGRVEKSAKTGASGDLKRKLWWVVVFPWHLCLILGKNRKGTSRYFSRFPPFDYLEHLFSILLFNKIAGIRIKKNVTEPMNDWNRHQVRLDFKKKMCLKKNLDKESPETKFSDSNRTWQFRWIFSEMVNLLSM